MIKVKCYAELGGSRACTEFELSNEDFAAMTPEEVEKMAVDAAMEQVDIWHEIDADGEDDAT